MKLIKLSIASSVLFLVLALNPLSYAQSTSLGIEGGINLSSMNITPVIPTATGRTCMMVGGFADIGFSRSFSVRPGVRFIMKGISNSGNGVTLTDKLSYLEFPVLLKATFPLTEVKPYIMAGPTVGIQLSASTEVNNGVQTQTFDLTNVYETIDFGLFFGSGIDFRVANRTDMFIGGGYSLGLSNVARAQNQSIKNTGLQFMAGIKFGL
jgi:hypothetical protein